MIDKNSFASRHIGPRNEDIKLMLKTINCKSLDDLIISVRKYNSKIDTFDCSCFNGEYITDGVSSDYLENLRETRKPK